MTGRNADILHTDPHRLKRRRWNSAEEHLDPSQQVEVIIEKLRCRLGREPVGVLKHADPGVDAVRCQDLGRNGCVVNLRGDISLIGALLMFFESQTASCPTLEGPVTTPHPPTWVIRRAHP